MYFLVALISQIPVRGRTCTVSYKLLRPLGLSCVWAELRLGVRASRRQVGRCLRACAGELTARRAVTAVFQENIACRDAFLDRGFREVGCGALLAAKAGEIVALAAKNRERAYLAARRADRGSLETARRLCESFRYLTLDVPAESFQRFEDVCGAAGVAPEPPALCPSPPDAAVFLCGPAETVFLPGKCVKLTLDGAGETVKGGREIGRISFTLPQARRFDLPFPAAPLLSAALEAGTVTPGEVTVAAAAL